MTESEYIQRISALCLHEDSTSAKPLRMVEKAIRSYSASARLHCLRGDLIQLLDDKCYQLEDALASYEHALKLDPNCAEAYESIGDYYDVVRIDLRLAENAFRKAIELGAGAASYVGLARVLVERGHTRKKILNFLDLSPYSDALEVREMRSEVERELWKPSKTK